MSGEETMFFSRFIAGNIFCSVFALLLMLVKALLGKRLTSAYHYRVWLLLMLALLAVFLPASALRPLWTEVRVNASAQFPTSGETGEISMPVLTEIHDAAVLAEDSQTMAVLGTVWALGAALSAGMYVKGAMELARLRRGAEPVSGRVLAVFEKYRVELGICGRAALLRSYGVRAPVSFGLFLPCVILPCREAEEMTGRETEHVLLHELVHIRRRDSALNLLACALVALYWCNPVVRVALAQMRRDREVYCDWSVLSLMNTQDERLSYGHTLLRFAGGRRERPACAENGLGGSSVQLRYRIERISHFQRRTRRDSARGLVLFTAAALLVALELPVLAEFAGGEEIYVPERHIAVEEVDYSALFSGKEGCALIYDMCDDRYIAYRPQELMRRIPACSTYKPFSALNALERGIITPRESTLSWDGRAQPFPEWCSDHNLSSAMRGSVNWYFQRLDELAGDTLTGFFDRTDYGDARELARFGSGDGAGLKISPMEQVELLRGLYSDTLGCARENTRAVREAMLLSESGGNRLYGKTGTGGNERTETLGWFVGWVESEGNVYFFAVSLRCGEGANGADAQKIARGIFADMGIDI